MKKLTFLSISFTSGAMIFLTPAYAHAYLDAGTGSMFIQLLFAGTAGVGAAARLVWHHLRDKAKSASSSESTQTTPDTQNSPSAVSQQTR